MLFNAMDIVSYKPYLAVFEEKRYKTLFGKLVGTLTIICISVLCAYFVITTFLRSEVSLIYNESRIQNKIDIFNSPFMLILTDGLNNPIPDIYQEVRINMWNYSNNGNSTYNTLEAKEIPLEPCTSESFGEFISFFKAYDYTKMKCIPYQKYNLTLFGTYGTADPGSFINIVVNMCNNKTMNNTCPDQSIIQPVLKNVYLHVLYIDYSIDNFNYTNPISPYVKSESFPINWDLHARYFYKFNSLSYITDVGSVFEDLKQEITYKYSNVYPTVQIRHGSSLYPGLTIGTLTIYKQSVGDQYNRSYPKLQTLLARIGGSIQAIMTIGQAICYFITKNMFLVEIINSNFSCDEDELDSKKIHKINKIEISNSSNIHLSNVLDGRGIHVSKKNITNLTKRITEEKKKEKLFKPGLCNYIFPNVCCPRKSKFTYQMKSAENVLLKKMSYENIFRHLIQYERLKKIVLSEEQHTLIDNLPKIKVEELGDSATFDKDQLIKSANIINEKIQDKIDDKLMKIFK